MTYNYFAIIDSHFEQQVKMYKDHIHSLIKRNVNIFNPHIRPVVIGNDKAQVVNLVQNPVSV